MGEGDDQLWGSGQLCGSGRGAIEGCHCSVLRLGGRVTTNLRTTNFGGGRGAIAGCPWHLTQQWHPEKASRKAALSILQT